ncbi:MAG: class I SAM-dependent methyltransferase [Verrucomicrobiales bacterium]|nr:class I SAM-dependent methyltransferase [Verrucomicrobiales bacterium]
MSGATRLRIHLTPAAENAVRQGHPWVYADRIRQTNRPGISGDLAALYDRRDRFLALGLFDPDSPIRVRVLHVGNPVAVDDAWWKNRLEVPLAKRRAWFGPDTTGWRWVHGENDGWPGLVIDRYEDIAVLKLYTAAWLPRLAHLRPILSDALGAQSLVLRLSRNIADIARRDHGLEDGSVLVGEPVTQSVVFRENGIRFEAEVLRGQKTGFFLDQRENRAAVERLANGKSVLNAFSFSGGFSLYAARGGASSVTDLDISGHALASARRNFALNQDLPAVRAARHETVQADTFTWLAEAADRRFDLAILDPPSMARRAAEQAGALEAYARLARLGASRIRPGGMLLAASCSAHVPAEAFFEAVIRGLRSVRVGFEVQQTTAHPADHPARFPEAHYLKAIYLHIKGTT